MGSRKKLRILVFSWRDPKHPNTGGAEQVMHEHMKGWVRTGHKVTLFVSRTSNLPQSEIIDGVSVVRCGWQYLGVQITGCLYYLKHRDKFDLVVDQFHGIPFFTPLYVKKPRLAVIQEVAREVWLKNDLPQPLNIIVGLIGYIFEPPIFLFYKKTPFMTGSESAKEDLIKIGIPAKNITIINHGVIVQKPNPFPRKEKIKTVMFLGAISKDKGIEDVLKVFASLKKKGNFQFWIVGRASDLYRKLIEDKIDQYGIKVNTNFFGFVSQEKKFELLARAHILVNPSVLEGWGLVNIEANAMGTPVVAYRSRGLIDSVKNGVTGILCQTNNPNTLAKYVVKVLNDKKLYKSLRKGSLAWADKFNWKSSVEKSLTLIKGII
jgi:glycosyltransferase involved in cell wall biosynthesis